MYFFQERVVLIVGSEREREREEKEERDKDGAWGQEYQIGGAKKQWGSWPFMRPSELRSVCLNSDWTYSVFLDYSSSPVCCFLAWVYAFIAGELEVVMAVKLETTIMVACEYAYLCYKTQSKTEGNRGTGEQSHKYIE